MEFSMLGNLINFFKKSNCKKSCNFLEYGGIHFVGVDKYQPCCPRGDYDWYLTYKLQKKLKEKGKFSAKEYKKHLKYIIRKNKKADALCKKCIYFKEQNWKKIDTGYLINHTLILSYHTTCNYRCDYCTIKNDEKNSYTEIPENITPVLKDMMEQKLINPKCIVHFSGGEPALLPYLSEILELFKNNGNRIIFYSNCTLFSKEIYEYLKLSDFNHIIVSIDAGTKEKYKEKRGRDLFDKAIANIEKYAEIKNKDNKAKLILKYIFSDNNLEESEIDGFIEICKKIQPFQVTLSPDFTKLDNMDLKNEIMNKTREKLAKFDIKAYIDSEYEANTRFDILF